MTPTSGYFLRKSSSSQCSMTHLGGERLSQGTRLILRGQNGLIQQDWVRKRGWDMILNAQGHLVYCSTTGYVSSGGERGVSAHVAE